MKEFLLNLFFPPFCIFCKKEGDYLCQDCFSFFDIQPHNLCLCEKPNILPYPGKCKKCQRKNLAGLHFALPYQNFFTKKTIQQFKYDPQVKGLAKNLASFIIAHFHLSEKPFSSLDNSIIIPVPLTEKKKRRRGFNQAEEIAKELGRVFHIPVNSDCLIKTKGTLSQMELTGKERQNSQKGAFSAQREEKINGRKVFLVDDVYTTGATMEECAKVLKEAGAKEVWGIAVARG